MFNNLAFASLLVFAIKTIKHSFHSQSELDQKNELNETIKNLQKTVLNIQTSVSKLEQTADQLNTTIQTPNPNRSLFEELKQEIQGLKELFSDRSQISSNVCQFLFSKKRKLFFYSFRLLIMMELLFYPKKIKTIRFLIRSFTLKNES